MAVDMSNKKSEKQIANEKSERILNGVAAWCAFYREQKTHKDSSKIT